MLVWAATDANFTGNEAPVVVAAGDSKNFHDKPYLAAGKSTADPNTQNNVYITWTDFALRGPRLTTGFPIRFSQSTNGGASFSTPVQVSDNTATQGSVPREAPDGSVYVVWFDFGPFGSGGPDSIQFDKSPFSASLNDDVKVADVVEIASPLPGWDFRVNSFPSMDVDRTRSGHIYVVFASDPLGDDAADVFFAKSTDFGGSWAVTGPLNDDGETAAHQFFPWLAVGSDGVIHVVWYDTRAVGVGSANEEINLYYTSSDDGGVTFDDDNTRVSAQGFMPNAGDQFGGGFIGDYNGLAASVDNAHALWTGYRDQDQDIFYATVGTGLAVNVALSTDKAEYSTDETPAILMAVVTDENGEPIGGLGSGAFATTLDDGTGAVTVTFAETTAGTYEGSLDISTLADGTYTVETTVTDTRPVTGSGSASFSMVAPSSAPEVDLCAPDEASPGERLPVTVTGSNFVDGATADFGERVTVQEVTFFSDGQLDVRVKVHPRAALGPRVVTVTNPDGLNGTLLGCFTVNP